MIRDAVRWLALLCTCGATSAAAQEPVADTSLVVSTGWLAKHLADPLTIVLQIGDRDSAYRAGHIPGSRWLPYQAFIIAANGISTELPSADSVRKVFASVGVSNASQVVLTGPPLEVARAFFTLDYLGFAHAAVLDGGVSRWKAEGRALEQRAPPVARGRITADAHPAIVATAGWVQGHIGKPGMSLIDTRRDDEYLGIVAASSGHIAGARRLEWQEMFRDATEFSLIDRAALERKWRERVAPGDTVVAYCRVGHRSSATYFVSRLLGYPVKLYDGSYEEWTKLGLPLVQAATPLLPLAR